MPDKIVNAPALQDGLSLYYAGFWALTTCRMIGMGEGPIPWTAVEMYCESNGIYASQRADFHYHISEMDEAYLEYRAGKIKAKTDASKPAPPTGKMGRRR